MKRLIMLLVIVLMISGCVEYTKIRDNLRKDGYNIKITINETDDKYICEKEGVLYYIEINFESSNEVRNVYKYEIPIK